MDKDDASRGRAAFHTDAVEEEAALDFPDLDALLAAAAARVVESVDPQDFVAWFVAESETLAPVFGGTLKHSSDGDLRAGFARALWNRFPQPSNRFRPRPLPAPSRNDPCVCGSGRKYKQCCRATEPPHGTIEALPLLLHVLDRYPDESLDALDAAPMDPDELLQVLDTWANEGAGERVVRLALPLFLSNRRLPRHAPEVLEVLLAHWPRGFREESFAALVDELAGSRDADIAVIAATERVRLHHEHDPVAAWALFGRELERFGEHPGLASLEVDMLVEEGRGEEALAAAERWRMRLLASDPALLEFADELLVRAAWVDPELALERACEEDDVLDRLVTLLDETPPGPVAGTHALPAPSAEVASGRALVLSPTPALLSVENDWRERFDGFGGLTDIVSHLDDAPLALSSFTVIESLATSLDVWAEESWAEAVFVRLLERAEMLLYRHVSRELGFETPEGLPDWDAMVWETAPAVTARHSDNRAALGLLSGLAGWYGDLADEGGGGERRAAALSRALAGLDPELARADAAASGRADDVRSGPRRPDSRRHAPERSDGDDASSAPDPQDATSR